MKKYEVRLSVSQWKNSNWAYRDNVVDVWQVTKSKAAEWIKGIKQRTTDLFGIVLDDLREAKAESDYQTFDNEWTMAVTETDNNGAEKILIKKSVWESEIAKEWFNNDLL